MQNNPRIYRGAQIALVYRPGDECRNCSTYIPSDGIPCECKHYEPVGVYGELATTRKWQIEQKTRVKDMAKIDTRVYISAADVDGGAITKAVIESIDAEKKTSAKGSTYTSYKVSFEPINGISRMMECMGSELVDLIKKYKTDDTEKLEGKKVRFETKENEWVDDKGETRKNRKVLILADI